MIIPFLIACVLATFFTPVVLRLSHHYGLFDSMAEARRIHTQPIPRLGGAAIFAAVAGTLLLLKLSEPWLPLELPGLPAGVVGGSLLIFAVGLYDDLLTVRPMVKLAVQTMAAALVYMAGLRVDLLTIGPELSVNLGVWSLPLTLLWIVGVTNAVNLIDGLDGLATGIGVVALSTILVMAAVLGNADVVLACTVLLGSLLGFLRYNFRPARIFLGDSGSLFIGFALAVLAVQGSLKSATALVVVVPVFALAVPLLDVGVAIGRRWLRGTPVFGADNRHIHHRLLALGLGHGRAAVLLYAVAAVLAMLGLSLAFAPPSTLLLIAAMGAIVVLTLFVYGLRTLNYSEFAEAGTVLASGFARMRRVIRDQIGAKDITQRLTQCASVDEMDAVLRAQADQFDFLAIEIARAPDTSDTKSPALRRAWKLDYPLGPDPVCGSALSLRIWCGLEEGSRPFGAERVARILGPSIEARLDVFRSVLAANQPGEPPLISPQARRLSAVHRTASADN